jgi:hypothetical protein
MIDMRDALLRLPRRRTILLGAFALGAVVAALGAGVYAWRLLGRRGVLVARQCLAVWEAPAGTPRDASMLARGSFELVNVGTAPVRVVDVQADCGCTTPEVTPKVIKPGGSAVVSVSALVVPFLSRELGINVHTDSAATPDVFLRLRVTGNQKPPLLVDASGDLSFDGAVSKGERRELVVVTVERKGDKKSPKLSADLPFLSFSEARSEESDLGGNVVQRKRVCWVALSRSPPAGTSVGAVTVEDPWDPTNTKKVNVLVRTRGP